jgi:hypothetical protein
MTSRSQSSTRSHCYREIPNDPAEVLVPEQPTISIKAGIAPQVAGGLHALVAQTLTKPPADKPAKDDRRARRTVVNRSEGTVNGTLFQIGNVEGGVRHYGDR